jgi:hypothetical protein
MWVLRGYNPHGWYNDLRVILILVIIVSTGNVEVSWDGLFESRPQQNCFQNFHFLLIKATYFQVYFFVFGLFFLSCSAGLGINKTILLINIKFWTTIII